MDLGEQTKMDDLDDIIEKLISELEGDDSSFKEIVNLSRTNLHSQNVRNPKEYFDLLENNLGREDMLDFLTNVTDFQNLHILFGTRRVADTLKECKCKLEELKQDWMKKNIFDSNFIGRDQEINDIMNTFIQNKDVNITGVSLWGAGGIGKTSIGNEVCRRLWASDRFWEVIKIDLRGKSSMGDLLKDIILELQKKDDQTMSDEATCDLQNSLKDTMDSKMQAIILQYLGNISHSQY
ncbi:uncharacterized protein [Argopecten irradians]|uniref:uncharacterized protein n=1 Tax=Argopecten irradians TaxID=31199 RepID=UPI00371F0C53